MDYILEVKDLSKQYRQSGFSLNAVSFGVPYGSIVGFVGENGAGKTTTISCILNALFKDSGTVTLFGREMTDADTQLREEIGVVFDTNHFSEHLNALQLSKVMQGIYSKWDQKLFLDYLDQFQIPLSKKIKSFSRGMAMKLSIAVALSHHSKLLILDEATSGLDPVVRDEILDVFLEFVQDDKHSIFLSSHITSDLEKIADYITFLHNGSIILTEKKDELLYQYAAIRCRQAQFESMDKADIISYRKRDYQVDVLVKNKKEIERKYKDLIVDTISVDEILLLLVKGERL